jgi:hypothetical protein
MQAQIKMGVIGGSKKEIYTADGRRTSRNLEKVGYFSRHACTVSRATGWLSQYAEYDFRLST